MKIPLILLSLALMAPAYELPPVLGDPPVTSSGEWTATQRPATLELFEKHVYGRNPVGKPADLAFETVEESPGTLGGTATRKIINITYSGPGGKGSIRLILFIPEGIGKPAPGFLLICNRSPDNIDPTRVKQSDFWPAEEIVKRGFVAASIHYADMDPDQDDDFRNGVHGIFDPKDTPRPPDAWASVAAWAWGASRVMDYFETDDSIDASRIAVVGHSRGGKTSLWAGVTDPRFAMVVSNDSGCTGAALSRRKEGERLTDINTRFPHWFCENYDGYNDREDDLPVDQHQLLALVAPRLLYVASASEDPWADPRGEFLATVNAAPAYRLFGHKALGTETMPGVDEPIHGDRVGYHIRAGKHDLSLYDWQRFMDFAETRL